MASFETFKNLISFLATLLISVTIEGAQLEVSGVLYESAFSNCNLTTAIKELSAPSLATCAAICTKSGTNKAFAVREGDCGLLETCPVCCSSTSGEADGWSVYCPKGKVATI